MWKPDQQITTTTYAFGDPIEIVGVVEKRVDSKETETDQHIEWPELPLDCWLRCIEINE